MTDQPAATTAARVLRDEMIEAARSVFRAVAPQGSDTYRIELGQRLLATLDAERTARQQAEHALALAEIKRQQWYEQSEIYFRSLEGQRQARERAEAALFEQTKAHGEDLAKLKKAEFLVLSYHREHERADKAEAALATERGRGERFAKAVKRACRYIPKGGDGLAGDMLLIALAVWTKPASAPSSQAAPHEPPQGEG